MRQSIKHIQEPALYLRLLVTKQAELLGELKSRREDIDELREPVPEVEEKSAVAHESSIAEKIGSIESNEFNRVNAALEKLRNGTYGRCEACRTSIPAPRLNAIPWAERCVTCEAESPRKWGATSGG